MLYSPQDQSGDKYWDIQIGSEILEHVTLELARAALSRHLSTVNANLQRDLYGHKLLVKLHDEQEFVATVSRVLGGHLFMVDLSIWNDAIAAVQNAQGWLRGDPRGTAEAITRAEEAYAAAYEKYAGYREGTIEGAGRSVTTLKATVIAGGIGASVATGGLSTTATTLILGGYAGTQEFATQTGEKLAGTRRGGEYEFLKILQSAGTEVATHLAGEFLSRTASEALQERVSRVPDEAHRA